MEITVRPLHPLFVGEVGGVDAGRPLDAATVRALDEAIDRYAVLVLRGQDLDDERQMAFARHFGELELPRSGRADVIRRLRPEMSDISNLDEQNRLRGRDDPRRFDQLGNRLWHTDGSFRRVPAMLSMLYAHRVPGPSPLGAGETEFADLRAAYDALPDATKAEIADLVALHDIAWSRAQLGFTDLLFGEKNVLPPVPQRVVRTPSGVRAQDALCRRARLGDRRLAAARRAALAARADRARDAARVRLSPRMARGRSRDLGQPLHDASGTAFRREPGARSAPGHGARHRLDIGGGRLT